MYLENLSDDIMIVVIEGSRMDANYVDKNKWNPEFRDNMTKYIVFDISEVKFLDSTALGFIVSTKLKCKKKQGDVIIVGCTPVVYEIFKLTRLDRVFYFVDRIADVQKMILEGYKPKS